MKQASVTVCPGCWRIAPRTSTFLQPHSCGVLHIGGGLLFNDRTLLRPGDTLRLWRVDNVELLNNENRAVALFSWDYCRDQPNTLATMRLSITRAMQAIAASARKAWSGTAP